MRLYVKHSNGDWVGKTSCTSFIPARLVIRSQSQGSIGLPLTPGKDYSTAFSLLT